MEIIRKYKLYLEKVSDSSSTIRTIEDLPTEVQETTLQIIRDMFESIRKPIFQIHEKYGLVIKFDVTENDFRFTDEDINLELDMSEGSKRKRTYEVVLIPVDLKDFKISETFTLMYKIEYTLRTSEDSMIEDEEDEIIEDDWEKPEEEDINIDDLEKRIKPGKVSDIIDLDEEEIEY